MFIKPRYGFQPRTEGSFYAYSDAGLGPGAPSGDVTLGGESPLPAGSSGDPIPTAAIPPTIDWESWSKPFNEFGERLSTKLDELQNTVRTATTPPPKIEEPPDLDTMSRVELTEYIVKKVLDGVQGHMAAQLKPILDTAQQAQVTATTVDLNRTIDRLKAEHKDFSDWKDEMVTLAKTHPSLGVAELYTLARGSNAKKAAELELKYNPPPPKPQPRFGGLLPGQPAGSAAAPKPLSPQEASTQAFAEVAARHPVLQALGNL